MGAVPSLPLSTKDNTPNITQLVAVLDWVSPAWIEAQMNSIPIAISRWLCGKAQWWPWSLHGQDTETFLSHIGK